MKTLVRLLIPLLVLSSCSPLSLYYREGESVSRMQSETTQCRVAALKDAPVANQVRQTAPTLLAGAHLLRRAGQMLPNPGLVGTRANLHGRCQSRPAQYGRSTMHGPKRVSPRQPAPCRQNVKSRVPATPTTTLPPLSTESCFVKFDDGSFSDHHARSGRLTIFLRAGQPQMRRDRCIA